MALVIITGASRGFGHSLCVEFARALGEGLTFVSGVRSAVLKAPQRMSVTLMNIRVTSLVLRNLLVLIRCRCC